MYIKAPIENKLASGYKLFSEIVSTKSTIKFFKDKSDSCSTNSKELVGGKEQEWKNVLEKISQSYVKQPKSPLDGEEMGELEHVKNINRLNCPITLDPKHSTFDDISLHARLRQRLAESTIEKNLRYARFMERHSIQVDFRNPSYENFIKHMDYREEIEHATPSALKNEWKAMLMFLKAWGIEKQWNRYKSPYYATNQDIILPYPETVHDFFHYKYSNDKYENKLYQYIFFIGFFFGVRPPSEICNMTLDNIRINKNGKGMITVIEAKKHGRKRVLVPEKYILSSKVHKSLKNWIEHWRPLVADKDEKTLFLTTEGKPFTPRYLGKKLREHGKKVWNKFHPYIMRHWCATARMIEWNYNLNRVSDWLGHSNINTTRKYVHIAQEYYEQDQGSWLKRALKSAIKKVGEESIVSTFKINRTPKTVLLNKIPPVKEYGLVGI